MHSLKKQDKASICQQLMPHMIEFFKDQIVLSNKPVLVDIMINGEVQTFTVEKDDGIFVSLKGYWIFTMESEIRFDIKPWLVKVKTDVLPRVLTSGRFYDVKVYDLLNCSENYPCLPVLIISPGKFGTKPQILATTEQVDAFITTRVGESINFTVNTPDGITFYKMTKCNVCYAILEDITTREHLHMNLELEFQY